MSSGCHCRKRVGREWKKQNRLKLIRESFLKAVWVSVRQKREQGRDGWRRKERVSRDGGGWVLGSVRTDHPSQSGTHGEKVGDTRFLSPCSQDVDGVFLSKMELEGKLEAQREYICFLRHLFEEVRICQGQGGQREGTGQAGSLW